MRRQTTVRKRELKRLKRLESQKYASHAAQLAIERATDDPIFFFKKKKGAYDPSLVPSTASMDTSKPLAPSFISRTSSKRAVSFDAELYFHLTARWPPFPLMDATPRTTHRPMGDLLNALQDDIERYTAKIAYDKARVIESRKEIEEMLVALPELDDNITQLMRQMPPYDAVTRDQIDRFSKRRASMQDMLREVPSLTEEQLHLDLTPRFYSLQERYEKKKVIHDMGILIWDSLVFATLFFMITLILMAFFFFRPSD
ncbi:hypothetical protein BC940DRAFT_310551 [Gongronella butleri]|nr:hypothetical protein BC940DRAFT_310551 [Gongronella butleri]